MTKLNIVYQFNEAYAAFAGVSITSVLMNNTKTAEINFYILGENLSKESINSLTDTVKKFGKNIIFKDTKDVIEQTKTWGLAAFRNSYAANLRMFLPFFIEDVDKILYLDADTIVKQPLDDLFETDMKEYPLGMVLDSMITTKVKQSIGFDTEDNYFNSGVILFQLDEWKKQKCTQRIIDYIKQHNLEFTAPDQDIINIVCKNQIFLLEPRYNFQPIHIAFPIKQYFSCYSDTKYYEKEMIEQSLERPTICHFFRFLGEFPWNEGSIHPYRKIYDYYLSHSLWKETAKIRINKTFFYSVEKVCYRLLPKCMFLVIFKYAHEHFHVSQSKLTLKRKYYINK